MNNGRFRQILYCNLLERNVFCLLRMRLVKSSGSTNKTATFPPLFDKQNNIARIFSCELFLGFIQSPLISFFIVAGEPTKVATFATSQSPERVVLGIFVEHKCN